MYFLQLKFAVATLKYEIKFFFTTMIDGRSNNQNFPSSIFNPKTADNQLKTVFDKMQTINNTKTKYDKLVTVWNGILLWIKQINHY